MRMKFIFYVIFANNPNFFIYICIKITKTTTLECENVYIHEEIQTYKIGIIANFHCIFRQYVRC